MVIALSETLLITKKSSLGGFIKINKIYFKILDTFRTASPFSIISFCETADRNPTSCYSMTAFNLFRYIVPHLKYGIISWGNSRETSNNF